MEKGKRQNPLNTESVQKQGEQQNPVKQAKQQNPLNTESV